jgi:hypothetical protein
MGVKKCFHGYGNERFRLLEARSLLRKQQTHPRIPLCYISRRSVKNEVISRKSEVIRKVTRTKLVLVGDRSQETSVEDRLEEKTVVIQVSRGSDQNKSDQN